MKPFLVFFLIIIIQVTSIQSVNASARLLEISPHPMMNCEMNEGHQFCSLAMTSMIDCQYDCDVTNMISVVFSIGNELLLSFACSDISYLDFVTSSSFFREKSLYRPPLFS